MVENIKLVKAPQKRCPFQKRLILRQFYVTYLLHNIAVAIGIKRCELAEIGRTIGFGSDDF